MALTAYIPLYRNTDRTSSTGPSWETSFSALRRTMPKEEREQRRHTPAAPQVDRGDVSKNSWKKCVFDPSAPTDVDAIALTIHNTFQALSKYGPKAIDLRYLAVSYVNGEHLASVLRATSTWQDQVPGWRPALWIAASALQQAGIDPKDALAGMI